MIRNNNIVVILGQKFFLHRKCFENILQRVIRIAHCRINLSKIFVGSCQILRTFGRKFFDNFYGGFKILHCFWIFFYPHQSHSVHTEGIGAFVRIFRRRLIENFNRSFRKINRLIVVAHGQIRIGYIGKNIRGVGVVGSVILQNFYRLRKIIHALAEVMQKKCGNSRVIIHSGKLDDFFIL